MRDFDCVVIGGGMLGCFTARELCRYQLSVALLERCSDVCTGISKANTAIVYSGYDTRPGTRKMQLCCRGNAGFAQLAQELEVPFDRCGSLMVCWGERGEAALRHKYRNGKENGVPGLRLISGEEAAELEPQLAPGIRLALLAPTTGTVNPYHLTIAAYENALANGCTALMNAEVRSIRRQDGGWLISTAEEQFRCRTVVNAAGLFADAIQAQIMPFSVRICPQRADYYLLDEQCRGLIRRIVFHQPEDGGKGLTLVPTHEGNLLLGPSEEPGSGDKEDFATSRSGLDWLDYWWPQVVPALPRRQVIRSFASLRPLLSFPGSVSGQVSGFELSPQFDPPDWVSFIGIKTPGMTCAAGLAQQAAEKICRFLGDPPRNSCFDPHRAAIPRLAALPMEQRQELIRRDPAFGRIVCQCRGVSEGEIIAAIRRGAATVNGVKRRVGATAGRCQGGFCLRRIVELIAREKGIPLTEVAWDEPGSEVLQGGSDA